MKIHISYMILPRIRLYRVHICRIYWKDERNSVCTNVAFNMQTHIPVSGQWTKKRSWQMCQSSVGLTSNVRYSLPINITEHCWKLLCITKNTEVTNSEEKWHQSRHEKLELTWSFHDFVINSSESCGILRDANRHACSLCEAAKPTPHVNAFITVMRNIKYKQHVHFICPEEVDRGNY